MRAIVYQGTRDVAVQTVDDAVIEDPEDVVVEITSSAICGTDLHMYDGRTGAEPGLVLGHEPLGIVREVGSDVHLARAGQRVVIPTHLYCGVCLQLRPRLLGGLPAGPARRVRRRLRVRGHGPVPRGAGGTAPGAVRRRELHPAARRAG
jgi:NADPH:quinone reductase-like Zn-dependent oxidoreductase